MRNTRLYIIISVVVLIIVAIIAAILSNQLKKGQESKSTDQGAEKIETSGVRILSRTEKIREASRITKQSNTSLLSDDQIKRLNKLSTDVSAGQGSIITGEDFDIGYSNITNLFCVQKKTPQADVEFKKYLTEKDALDIYEKDPSLFVTADENCSTYLKKQEEYIVQDLELDDEVMPEEENISNNRAKKDAETFSKFIKIFSSYNTDISIGEDSTTTPDQTTESGSLNSILDPSNIGVANANSYYMMPTAPNGEYIFGGWNRCDSHKLGSKTLVGVIYTVAKRWNEKYPNSKLEISDLSGVKKPQNCPTCEGHSSHGNGVDVDIRTTGSPLAGYINGPIEANIDLGKMFIDTGVIKIIIFGVSSTNQRGVTIRNAWKEYANSKGLAFQPVALPKHDTHFHVRINDQFRLAEFRPGSCR